MSFVRALPPFTGRFYSPGSSILLNLGAEITVTSPSSAKPNHYLLEIGTEELPPAFMHTVCGDLSDRVSALLTQESIPFAPVVVEVSPRRIALMLSGLPADQPDSQKSHKGPPVRIAFDASGAPTRAATAFAQKCGCAVSDLQQGVPEGANEPCLTFHEAVRGQSTPDFLQQHLPKAVLSLAGPRFMRWGEQSIRFVRPIRWLVSVWNQDVLPLQLGTITADRLSRGHRFLTDTPVSIPSATDYLDVMARNGHVQVSTAQRRTLIWEQLCAKAQTLGGHVEPNDALLDAVTALTESPWVLAGAFDPDFLDIPESVIMTAMALHQKYFPVHDAQGRLMPAFLAVSNASPTAEAQIRRGNERVLQARLQDARFFFEEDCKTPLADRGDALAGMTFQKGLGSVADKVQRLAWLAEQTATMMDLPQSEITHVSRAAKLCKADLSTQMVFEFTELQGQMGQHYARLQGEPDAIADAIYEHYLPRFQGDALPKTPVGIALALADKIDTLAAVFNQQKVKMPTGSKDPLGLRRLANGLLLTVQENALTAVDLMALFELALQGLATLPPAMTRYQPQDDGPDACQRFEAFMLQRLKGLLLDKQYRYDVIDAVLGSDNSTSPLTCLTNTHQRLEMLRALMTDSPLFEAIAAPAHRIQKILGSDYQPKAIVAGIDKTLLKMPSEQSLFQAIASLPAEASPQSIAKLQSLVHAFFEDVMVNDPDAALKQNRHALLSVLNHHYAAIADFTRLVNPSTPPQ